MSGRLKAGLCCSFVLFSTLCYPQNNFRFTSDEKCSTVRLDLAPPLNRIPIYTQGGSQFCSAYAAATLIDHWRMSNNQFDGKLTAPVPLFFQYQRFTGKFEMGSVAPSDLLKTVSKFGRTCTGPIATWLNNVTPNVDGAGAIFDCGFKAAVESRTIGQSSSSIFEQCIARVPVHGAALAVASRLYSGPIVTKQDMSRLFSVLTEELCRSSESVLPQLPAPQSVIGKGGSHGQRMNSLIYAVNQSLDEATPIGISYCQEVLKDIDHEGVSEIGEIVKKNCNPHASVIVGRRLLRFSKKGKEETICQLLVRDNYGESCSGYPDDSSTSPSQTCERGQVWVDENALLKNTNLSWRFPK